MPRGDISAAKGSVWLGIDAGSTTIKAVLLDQEDRILYEYYGGNQGTPLSGARRILEDLYAKLPEGVTIAGAGVTGYGEELIKRALETDVGEVETMAHYRGAKHFLPDVTTILDIGGQDMKCCRIKDGAVDDILLNEACSSGCGSFLDTFARSLGMDIGHFAKIALSAKHPVDLGSRCTVFMNSRVREAQKNGVSVADISAGLSYSVIKNALYKVIRLKKASDLGERVVVQGGTFYNDAVLRALELLLGREVIRPDVAGLMGAYGMALITRDTCPAGHVSTLVTPEKLKALSYTNEMKRCPGCGNHCMITLTRFNDGRAFVSGNRCERGASLMLTGKSAPHSSLPNMYRWKEDVIWHRRPLLRRKRSAARSASRACSICMRISPSGMPSSAVWATVSSHPRSRSARSLQKRWRRSRRIPSASRRSSRTRMWRILQSTIRISSGIPASTRDRMRAVRTATTARWLHRIRKYRSEYG